jgi:hypothetical protein
MAGDRDGHVFYCQYCGEEFTFRSIRNAHEETCRNKTRRFSLALREMWCDQSGCG